MTEPDALEHPIIQFGEERLAVLDHAGEVRVVVHRKNNISMACSVRYETADASAKAGDRYLPSSGVVHFAEMQTRAEITIGLDAGKKKQLPECTFHLALTAAEPEGALIGRHVAFFFSLGVPPALLTP